MALDLPQSDVLDFIDFPLEALPSLRSGCGGLREVEGVEGRKGVETQIDR